MPLQAIDLLPGVVDLRTRLQHQLETRLEGERVGHTEDLCVCTMLDPRFKNFDFKRVTISLRADARKWLINNFVENWADVPEIVSVPEDPAPLPKRRKTTGFLDSDSDGEDALAELSAASEDEEGGGQSSQQELENVDPRREEVMKYLALPQVLHTEDFDLLVWWKTHQALFPNLAKMARQYLAMPASSAGVERLFSAAGSMHDKKRKRTSEKTLSHMLNIKVNAL